MRNAFQKTTFYKLNSLKLLFLANCFLRMFFQNALSIKKIHAKSDYIAYKNSLKKPFYNIATCYAHFQR